MNTTLPAKARVLTFGKMADIDSDRESGAEGFILIDGQPIGTIQAERTCDARIKYSDSPVRTVGYCVELDEEFVTTPDSAWFMVGEGFAPGEYPTPRAALTAARAWVRSVVA